MPYQPNSQQIYPPTSDPSPDQVRPLRTLRTLRPAPRATPTSNYPLNDLAELTGVGTQFNGYAHGRSQYNRATVDLDGLDLSYLSRPQLPRAPTTGYGNVINNNEFSQYPGTPWTSEPPLADHLYNRYQQHYPSPAMPVNPPRQQLDGTLSFPQQTPPSTFSSRTMPLPPLRSIATFSENGFTVPPRFICDWDGCNVTTKREKDMDRHKATVHGDWDWRCKVCGRIKPRDDRLRASCRKRHPEEAPDLEPILRE